MDWPPSPAFVAKIQREVFPELPLSGESLLTVLEWIEENLYDRQHNKGIFPSNSGAISRRKE
jgi:hypothetical protein